MWTCLLLVIVLSQPVIEPSPETMEGLDCDWEGQWQVCKTRPTEVGQSIIEIESDQPCTGTVEAMAIPGEVRVWVLRETGASAPNIVLRGFECPANDAPGHWSARQRVGEVAACQRWEGDTLVKIHEPEPGGVCHQDAEPAWYPIPEFSQVRRINRLWCKWEYPQ